MTPEQHFTQPPPRYTEATLVKRLEELGIGRPSTYASIITTIQDREYVRKEKNRLHPEDKGRLVTAFLETYFNRYVSYDFTAKLEEELDDISGGRVEWKDVLGRFWTDFSAAIAGTADLRIGEVLEKINEVLAPHLFPDPGDGSDPRLCTSCGTGRLALKTALSSKRADGKLIVVDAAALKEPKTKSLSAVLGKLGLSKVLFIDGPEVDANFHRAAANLIGVDVLPQQGANVYDILRCDTLVLTRAAVEHLEARLK